MDVWVLRFLLTAREHLREQKCEGRAEGWRDLQAIERALPDADWFEFEEFREGGAPSLPGLWSDPAPRLEF